MKSKLSIIIIAENEEKLIGNCFKSAAFADELILLDGGSTDKTIEIAKGYQARVISQIVKEKDWAAWHNQGKKEAQGEWLFYLDADERITPELQKEIISNIQFRASRNKVSLYPIPGIFVFAVPRLNILLGKKMHFGGWYPDYQIRLFYKDKLDKWVGKLHERPVFEGQLGYLKQPIKHLAHHDLSSMVEKTNYWTLIEARLLYEAHHPPMAPWRFFRIMGTEFFDRFIKKQAWRDGIVGWVEGLFQIFNKFLIYARLWELQKEKRIEK